MKKVIVLYVPILHQGYFDFFQRHKDIKTLYLPGNSIIQKFTSLEKEIRQIDPETIAYILKRIGLFNEIIVMETFNIPFFRDCEIITANDSLSLRLVEKYFPDSKTIIDSVFLRWDEKNVYSNNKVHADFISKAKQDIAIMQMLLEESKKSPDWWRQVGAGLVKNGQLKFKAYNQPLPSEHTPYALGDPRDHIEAGKYSHLTGVLHSEQAIIAKAAECGVALKDASIYTTVFPCPMCANLIAYSGIKNLYFLQGHASLNGLAVLKTNNVQIIKVQI